jgi:hypothetical protein
LYRSPIAYYELTTENEQIKIWTIKVVDKKYKQIDKDSYKYFSQLNPEYDKGEQEEVDKIKFHWLVSLSNSILFKYRAFKNLS